ncbi:MAG TPA: hypothetical protein VIM48_00395, partial [Chthoniobacterales bacterium]
MDEDKEELPPFRWNWQAVFMLFFTMAALAIPFGGIVWFLRGYLYAQQREHAAHAAPASPQPAATSTLVAAPPSPIPVPTATPPKPPVDAAALAQSLEHAAESQLGSETKLEDENSTIGLTLPS